MRCTEARPLFPLYLDSAVTGLQMHAVSEHMDGCVECRSEYKKLENTRLIVSALGRRPVPADLSLKIKLSLSRQKSRGWRNLLRSYAVRLEDTLNAFMVPATAGVLTAVIFFGALIGFFHLPQNGVEDVVPASFSSLPARLQSPQSAMSSSADTELNLDSPVYVQVYVDVSGKVQNYEIVSGPDDENVRSQLNRALLFTSFSPAYEFGQPVPGRTIISFSHINVKG